MGGRTGGVTTDITLMEPQRRTPRRCAADRNDSLTIRRPNASGRVAAHSRHLCDRPPRREGAGNPDDQRCPSASRSHLPFILRFTSTRGSCHRRQQQRGDATPRCVGGGEWLRGKNAERERRSASRRLTAPTTRRADSSSWTSPGGGCSMPTRQTHWPIGSSFGATPCWTTRTPRVECLCRPLPQPAELNT
jgi:hypothetical protein